MLSRWKRSNRFSHTWAGGRAVLVVGRALRGGGAEAAALGLGARAPGAACPAATRAAAAT